MKTLKVRKRVQNISPLNAQKKKDKAVYICCFVFEGLKMEMLFKKVAAFRHFLKDGSVGVALMKYHTTEYLHLNVGNI